MKEKDDIERWIAQNLEGLNDNEPPQGHFDRFEERLRSQHKRRGITLTLVLKAVAVVVFAFLAVNQGIIWFSSDDSPTTVPSAAVQQDMTLASVSPEYEEVEFYFTNAIEGGLSQWEEMVNQGFISGEEQEMMNTELEEFEQVYEKLREDLAASPNDERIINAMIEHYQSKLSLISMIVNKLEEVKQKNNRNHETEI